MACLFGETHFFWCWRRFQNDDRYYDPSKSCNSGYYSVCKHASMMHIAFDVSNKFSFADILTLYIQFVSVVSSKDKQERYTRSGNFACQSTRTKNISNNPEQPTHWLKLQIFDPAQTGVRKKTSAEFDGTKQKWEEENHKKWKQKTFHFPILWPY